MKIEQNYPQAQERRPQRILVLSHMFPRTQNRINGCFVAEQVKALRQYESLDVRVVCCLPKWMSFPGYVTSYLSFTNNYQSYLDQFNSSVSWSDWDGVPVMYLPYRVGNFIRFSFHAWSYCSSVMSAADWIWGNFKFDLIHAHTSFLDGSAGVALSKKYEVPLVITEHTGPFSLLTQNPLVKQITIESIKSANQVLCVSEALATQVRSHLDEATGKSIKIFPNGFYDSMFYPSEPSTIGEDNTEVKLLFVGSLDDNKNPLLLLKSFDIIREKLPQATLRIVGEGPLANHIESWIKERKLSNSVFYLGVKSRQEVAELMRSECDIFVLPSNSETFSCVVMEALACGKPVVSTRCGGPEDIITDSFLGELCPTQDPQALAQAVIKVASSLQTYQVEGIANYARTHFGYEFLASRLVNIYQNVSSFK
jgi:glycosyltransferase involved in cell wall biosynthesis